MPKWLDRMTQGDRVAVADLQALANAAGAIYDALGYVEEAKRTINMLGTHLWLADEAARSMFMATWVGNLGQSAGNAMLEAGQVANGFVSVPTADQAQVLFQVASDWSVRAVAAHGNAGYKLDLPLPAPPMRLLQVQQMEVYHARALRAATQSMRAASEAALADVEAGSRDSLPPVFHAGLAQATQMLTQANALSDNLNGLTSGSRIPEEVRREIYRVVANAWSKYWWLVQALAMPRLFGAEYVVQKTVSVTDPKIRGPQFDPGKGKLPLDLGVLTDPEVWPTLDSRRLEQLKLFWLNDPDSAATIAIQQQINLAQRRGFVEIIPHMAAKDCPWQSTYVANRDVTIAGQELARGDRFQYRASQGRRRISVLATRPPATPPTPEAAPPVHHGPRFDPTAGEEPAAAQPPAPTFHRGPRFDPGASDESAAPPARPRRGPRFDPHSGEEPPPQSEPSHKPRFDPHADDDAPQGGGEERQRPPRFDPFADDDDPPPETSSERPRKFNPLID